MLNGKETNFSQKKGLTDEVCEAKKGSVETRDVKTREHFALQRPRIGCAARPAGCSCTSQIRGSFLRSRRTIMKAGKNNAGVSVLERPHRVSRKKAREAFETVVQAIKQEYDCFIPPFRRVLYMHLFAKLEGKQLPESMAKELAWRTHNREHLEYYTRGFNQLVGDLSKEAQQWILVRLLKDLEPEIKAYEEDVVREDVKDKLLDILSDWSTERIASLAEQLKGNTSDTIRLSA
jgi:hypothetical protein